MTAAIDIMQMTALMLRNPHRACLFILFIMMQVSSGTWAIASYCLSSILMTVTNKLVLSSYEFKLNFLLLAVQNGTCVVLLELFALAKLASHRPFQTKEAKYWFIVALALVFMVVGVDIRFTQVPVRFSTCLSLSLPSSRT